MSYKYLNFMQYDNCDIKTEHTMYLTNGRIMPNAPVNIPYLITYFHI